jgi:tRNA (guanine-N7-)-methyltransferase
MRGDEAPADDRPRADEATDAEPADPRARRDHFELILPDPESRAAWHPTRPLEPPFSWPALFGDDRPVELEVGPGKGLFLANAASQRPGHNFLGVELARKYAHAAASRLAKKGLTNARVVAGDARRFLARMVPPASLHALHIYFPDPWWKKRHKKRRVFDAEFVADVARALRPGGDFHMATDVEDYFGVMREVMAAAPEFLPQPAPEPKVPEHDLDYLTNFERKYRIAGRAIFRAHYRRAAGP